MDPTALRIVPYESRLRDGVFAFTRQCFEELGKAFEPGGRHVFYNDIEGCFEVFLCLLDGDGVVGTVALKGLDAHMSELKALYLSRELRGRGLGRQLLECAVNSATELGYTSIVLDSMSSYTDALRLYEKVGFEYIDRYNDNQYADVFMGMDI